MVRIQKDQFLLSDDKQDLQIGRIHRFLSEEAYWSLGIPLAIVEKAIESSLCFGLYDLQSKLQIGFARVVTDRATFAWLCDVYVEPAYRGQKLGHWMIENLQKHPDLQTLRRFCLTTKDAQGLYEPFGFEVTKTPSYWMEIKNNDIYKRKNEPL